MLKLNVVFKEKGKTVMYLAHTEKEIDFKQYLKDRLSENDLNIKRMEKVFNMEKIPITNIIINVDLDLKTVSQSKLTYQFNIKQNKPVKM